MCGIAGSVRLDSEASSDRDLVSRMCDVLAHRGPDAEGLHAEGPVVLGHRRLSILDLSEAGRQPMANEDGSVWLSYNGQLYGFEDDRRWLEARGHVFRSHTDTEVIVHLYEEVGDALLERIDGMFAFALWDARRRRLLLARDRLGIKPLYYCVVAGRLLFASELKALLVPGGAAAAAVDPAALMGYLHFMSVPGEIAIVPGVRRLPPAHRAVVERGALAVERYWELRPEGSIGVSSLEAAADDFAERFRRAVTSHMVADVPVGAFLSGGVDSSLVVGAAQEATGTRLRTFSAAFREDPACDESAQAREVASLLGSQHHDEDLGCDPTALLETAVWHADEPFGVSSALPLLGLSRSARPSVKVVLTGDGGDEIFAGYPWRHRPESGDGARVGAWMAGLAQALLHSARAAAWGGSLPRRWAVDLSARLRRLARRPGERYAERLTAFTPEDLDVLLRPELREEARRRWAENIVQRRFETTGDVEPIARRLLTDLQTTLVDEMLTKVDRMTMAVGLEARVPFLDRRLVEWAFALPPEMKLDGGVGKRVLRAALARRVPEALAWRPKHGFNVPLARWLRTHLRPMVEDALSPQTVARRGLFDARAVASLWRAHLHGRADLSRRVYVLLALELWMRRFIDRPVVAARETPAAGLPAAVGSTTRR
jgi:asparagine synthase (glutamine-hydrolysing)